MKSLLELAKNKTNIRVEDNQDRKEFLEWYLKEGGSTFSERNKPIPKKCFWIYVWISSREGVLYNYVREDSINPIPKDSISWKCWKRW